MNLPLPDKWIRKAIRSLIHNMVVDTVTVPCYDYRVSGNTIPSAYVIMSTQSNVVNRRSKCGGKWESDLLLEVVVKYQGTNNPGTRLLADNILDNVRSLTQNLTLDVASGLKIVDQTESFPNDLATITETENVFRKFIRYELLIN